jgi:hypothetical protein
MCAVYLPLLVGQVLYQRDVTRQLYPERDFLHESYRQGDSPLWNPLLGLGLSTLANPLNEIFYPPNASLVLAHSPRTTSFFLLFHLVLGGLGMMVLLRQLVKAPAPAALVAGLAWCLSGYSTSEVVAGMRLMSGAYLPWSAVGLVYLSRLVGGGASLRRTLAGVAWAALPLGLCFTAGDLFFVILAGMFAVCVALGDTLAGAATEPIAWRRWIVRFAIGVGLTVVVAGLLGSATIVPAQRAARGSDRLAAFPRQVAEVGSFHPWRLAEMAAQGAMGDPYTNYPAGPWVGEPGLGGRPLLYGVYVGSGLLALALLAFGRRRPVAALLGIVAVFFLFVSFGRHTWLHGAFRILVPPLAFMRGPEKYLAIVTASLSLLAGLGCARILDRNERLWMRALLVPAALVALALAAGLFPPPMVAGVRTSAFSTLPFALAGVALIWLAGRSARLAGPLLVALVAVDMARSVFTLQNFVAPEQLGGEPEAARAVLADARARGHLAPPRVYRAPDVDRAIESALPPTTVAQVQRNLVSTLIDNHAGSFGVGCVPGYDAATPAALTALWQGGLRAGLDLLRLTGTEYVVLPKGMKPRPDLDPLLDPAPGVRLFHVEGALPRVYLSQASAPMPDAQALSAVFAPKVVAGDEVILAASPAPPPTVTPGEPNSGSLGQCQLRAFSHARVEAECEAHSAALAVFLEQYDEGWSATVDGQRTPVLRANLVMRAVPLAKGRHRIVLRFSPAGLALGVCLSIAGIVAFIAFVLLGRRR